MSMPAAWPQVLDFFGTPLTIEPSAGQLSSDAGLLPLRQFDERIGLTQAFAALDDPRNRAVRPYVGVRGRCGSEASPGRSSGTNGLDASRRRPCGEGL